MPDFAYLGLAALFTLLGMAWLALAMDVHWVQVSHPNPGNGQAPGTLLRLLAVFALVLSLLACLQADRPSIAVLVWIMLMVGAAATVAFVLASRPRLFRICWPF